MRPGSKAHSQPLPELSTGKAAQALHPCVGNRVLSGHSLQGSNRQLRNDLTFSSERRVLRCGSGTITSALLGMMTNSQELRHTLTTIRCDGLWIEKTPIAM